MISYITKDLSAPKLQAILSSAIGPRPIAFASTIDEDGTNNLSPFSFFNLFSSNPPIVVFSPARRVRDNTTKHTYENILKHPEVVINVVTYDMVHQASLASTEYGKGVDEFVKAGFTAIASDLVKPMRVKESPVQLECSVKQTIPLGTEGGAGILVICEILKIHVSESVTTNDKIDQHKIRLVGRLGENWYTKAFDEALFEVPKPLTTLGIGIDALPEYLKGSNVFTGNDLGMMGNIERYPSYEQAITAIQQVDGISEFINNHVSNSSVDKEYYIHNLAKKYLSFNQVELAVSIMVAAYEKK
jgi:flavin reductase (DIM6/NTAB) family NADH-FMN oxidoreductase RutF